jgi:hypothetical protein
MSNNLYNDDWKKSTEINDTWEDRASEIAEHLPKAIQKYPREERARLQSFLDEGSNLFGTEESILEFIRQWEPECSNEMLESEYIQAALEHSEPIEDEGDQEEE